MEKGTLAFGGQALLADEGGFSAVCINTDHEAFVPIYAVRAVFDGLAHVKNNIESCIKCGH